MLLGAAHLQGRHLPGALGNARARWSCRLVVTSKTGAPSRLLHWQVRARWQNPDAIYIQGFVITPEWIFFF